MKFKKEREERIRKMKQRTRFKDRAKKSIEFFIGKPIMWLEKKEDEWIRKTYNKNREKYKQKAVNELVHYIKEHLKGDSLFLIAQKGESDSEASISSFDFTVISMRKMNKVTKKYWRYVNDKCFYEELVPNALHHFEQYDDMKVYQFQFKYDKTKYWAIEVKEDN